MGTRLARWELANLEFLAVIYLTLTGVGHVGSTTGKSGSRVARRFVRASRMGDNFNDELTGTYGPVGPLPPTDVFIARSAFARSFIARERLLILARRAAARNGS